VVIGELYCFFLLFFFARGVIFITVFERKCLGLSQLRAGPLKVGFWGALQPGLDGIKLILKNLVGLVFVKKFFFVFFSFFFCFFCVWF